MTEQQQRSEYQRAGRPATSERDRERVDQQSGHRPGSQTPAMEDKRPDTDQESGYQGSNGGRYAGRQGEVSRDDTTGDFHGAPASTESTGSGRGGGDPQATDPGQADQSPGGPPAGEPGLERFRGRWPSVQGAFVDDPKGAVGEADSLVAEVIQDLERSLTRERERMQGGWTYRDPDTEQLRQFLYGYRALFQRLVDAGV